MLPVGKLHLQVSQQASAFDCIQCSTPAFWPGVRQLWAQTRHGRNKSGARPLL